MPHRLFISHSKVPCLLKVVLRYSNRPLSREGPLSQKTKGLAAGGFSCATSATKTGDFIYGPYLRSIPPLPVGANQGENGVAAADGAGVGWIYDEDTGTIASNTTAAETNGAGTPWGDF